MDICNILYGLFQVCVGGGGLTQKFACREVYTNISIQIHFGIKKFRFKKYHQRWRRHRVLFIVFKLLYTAETLELMPVLQKTAFWSRAQACTRITELVGWLFGCHHAENGLIHRMMGVDCPIVITSIYTFQARPDQE